MSHVAPTARPAQGLTPPGAGRRPIGRPNSIQYSRLSTHAPWGAALARLLLWVSLNGCHAAHARQAVADFAYQLAVTLPPKLVDDPGRPRLRGAPPQLAPPPRGVRWGAAWAGGAGAQQALAHRPRVAHRW